jgi:hypothetical protein
MSRLSIVLIMVLTGLTSALFTSVLMSVLLIGKQRRRERSEDKVERQEVANRLLTQNKKVELAALDTKESLKEIHTLVNSQLTDAKVSELESARLTLILAKRIIARDEKDGITPTQEDRDTIRATQAKIEKLEALVKDRAAQQAKVDAQVKAAE